MLKVKVQIMTKVQKEWIKMSSSTNPPNKLYLFLKMNKSRKVNEHEDVDSL